MPVRRIDQDHTRFRQIVDGRIKRDLRKFVSSGELVGKQGDRFVTIPLPQIALPRFRQVRAGGASDELDRTPLLEWSIEQVCQWVGKQPFSSYRSKFRDGMVSGAVLLSLTDKGESRNAET